MAGAQQLVKAQLPIDAAVRFVDAGGSAVLFQQCLKLQLPRPARSLGGRLENPLGEMLGGDPRQPLLKDLLLQELAQALQALLILLRVGAHTCCRQMMPGTIHRLSYGFHARFLPDC